MLEATNFESGNTVSLLFRAIADRSCGNGKSAPVTKAFTKYCDILQTSYRKGLKKDWIKPELRSVSKSIKNFKDHALSEFQRY